MKINNILGIIISIGFQIINIKLTQLKLNDFLEIKHLMKLKKTQVDSFL